VAAQVKTQYLWPGTRRLAVQKKFKSELDTSHQQPANVRLLELAAHDLRNPLGGILASAQYLLEDCVGVLEPHHLKVLGAIEFSARSMLRLLEEMIEISTIESGAARLDLRSTDIGSMVEQVVSMNRTLADSERVNLELKVDGQVPAVISDPVKLSKALGGLLMNAIRSSRAGGVVEVLVGAQGKHATIRVRENGRGSSTDTLRALFQTPEGTRSKRGLAVERAARVLANAKRIVEAHRGAIRVETDGHQQPEVTLMLPSSMAGTPRHRKASSH